MASGGQGSKLDALIAGKRVLDWTLSAVRATGLPFHVEDAGHPGMGDSIAAAVAVTQDAQAWLILPGDLPLVQPETILAVAQALQNGAQAAYPVYQGERGHPVGFSVDCREKLLNLKGNRGAALILSALNAIELIVNDRGCVSDVDTQQQLEALRKRVQPV
jgi:molybdenum cofactor cytidylyltransferase